MDRLGALSLFAKAVETGSFSEAGRQSGLAPSSVSRRIVELESWVGAALFHRTTRKLNLTEVGRSFYERTRGILLDLEEARVMAAQLEDHPTGLVRLTIPASMDRHLTAGIVEFQARWPGVRFALTFSDRMVDLVGEGYDLAVRVGPLEDSTLRARKIGAARRFLCASPRYLDRAGVLERPEDLEGHNCLIFRTHPGYNVWRFKSGGRTVEALPGRFLDFQDPWGNRIEIVGYDNIQFTKAPNVLRGMGLEHLTKNEKAIEELTGKGMAPE